MRSVKNVGSKAIVEYDRSNENSVIKPGTQNPPYYIPSPLPYNPYAPPGSEISGCWYPSAPPTHLAPMPQYPGNPYVVYCQHPPGTASTSGLPKPVNHAQKRSVEQPTPVTPANKPREEPIKVQQAEDKDDPKNEKIDSPPALAKDDRNKMSIDDTVAAGKDNSPPKSETSDADTIITVPSNNETNDIYPQVALKEMENLVKNDPEVGKTEEAIVNTIDAVKDVVEIEMTQVPNDKSCKYKTLKCFKYAMLGLKYLSILAAASSIMYAAVRPLIEHAPAESATKTNLTDLVDHSTAFFI